jgi:protease-4
MPNAMGQEDAVGLRRGVVVVSTVVGMAVLVALAGVVFLYLVLARGPSVPSPATLVLRPGGALQEIVPNDVLGQLVGRDTATVRGFVETLRMAKRDARIRSVVLMPSGLELPFWGKAQELRDAVLDFRASGKTVTAFLEYGGDRQYFLASAANRVFLLPTSPLDLGGIASYEVFLRGAFDTIGTYPDFLHVGQYKTAVNTFTERAFTAAHREMSESLNRDMYDQLVRGLAEARGKTEAEMRALVDEGPFSPEDALRAGLVDGLEYEDQLPDRVDSLRADNGEVPRIDGADYQRTSPRAAGLSPRSRVAVLYAVGTITSGTSGFDPVNGPIVGSDTMVEQIRRLRDDDSIKAIVLRVDSPGGSSVASDVIWRELTVMRDANPSRPLVVSMGDLAASGGYYIAMAGQVIVAQPGTLTGSIGVFSGKMVVRGTLEKLGVTTETVTSGRNAAINSPFAPFSEEQRAKVQHSIQRFYDTFVERAAASRRSTPERIAAVAQGRVWTGEQAKQHGLVDELGGLRAAIEIAKQRAGIPADEDVEVVVYPPRRSFYEALTEQLSPTRLSVWSLLARGAEWRALAAVSAPMRLFRPGEPLALMPFAFAR